MFFLELKGDNYKTPYPFKFNATWLEDGGFHTMVKDNWMVYQEDS